MYNESSPLDTKGKGILMKKEKKILYFGFFCIVSGLFLPGCMQEIHSAKNIKEVASVGIDKKEIDSASCIDFEIEKLNEYQEKINIGNQEIYIETYIWVNFQPQIFKPENKPDGLPTRPLSVIIRIKTSDKGMLSEQLEADRLWIVNKTDIWETTFSKEVRPKKNPWSMEKIVRNGPEWSINSSLDVVVRINENGRSYLIKASGQKIASIF